MFKADKFVHNFKEFTPPQCPQDQLICNWSMCTWNLMIPKVEWMWVSHWCEGCEGCTFLPKESAQIVLYVSRDCTLLEQIQNIAHKFGKK